MLSYILHDMRGELISWLRDSTDSFPTSHPPSAAYTQAAHHDAS